MSALYEPSGRTSASERGLPRPAYWWLCPVCSSQVPPGVRHIHLTRERAPSTAWRER